MIVRFLDHFLDNAKNTEVDLQLDGVFSLLLDHVMALKIVFNLFGSFLFDFCLSW